MIVSINHKFLLTIWLFNWPINLILLFFFNVFLVLLFHSSNRKPIFALWIKLRRLSALDFKHRGGGIVSAVCCHPPTAPPPTHTHTHTHTNTHTSDREQIWTNCGGITQRSAAYKTSTGVSRCPAEASVRWQVRLQTLDLLISITLWPTRPQTPRFWRHRNG